MQLPGWVLGPKPARDITMSAEHNSQRHESPSEVTTSTELGAMHRDPETGKFLGAYREGDSPDQYEDY